MGVQDLIFAFVNILQMLPYVHQGGGGWGGVNVPDAYFTYVTAHVAVVNMLHMPSYIHQGRRVVLTLLTNISVTLRNTLPLLTCCTCRCIFIRGVGGCINVPDEYFAYLTEHVAIVKCCQHVAHAVEA